MQITLNYNCTVLQLKYIFYYLPNDGIISEKLRFNESFNGKHVTFVFQKYDRHL